MTDEDQDDQALMASDGDDDDDDHHHLDVTDTDQAHDDGYQDHDFSHGKLCGLERTCMCVSYLYCSPSMI